MIGRSSGKPFICERPRLPRRHLDQRPRAQRVHDPQRARHGRPHVVAALDIRPPSGHRPAVLRGRAGQPERVVRRSWAQRPADVGLDSNLRERLAGVTVDRRRRRQAPGRDAQAEPVARDARDCRSAGGGEVDRGGAVIGV